ncbi:MAG: Do family serine endopeptidase [Elusimicrobia bacterium]|nr:Do family serine endopeptidase [Elusimicrobiota bacterium]
MDDFSPHKTGHVRWWLWVLLLGVVIAWGVKTRHVTVERYSLGSSSTMGHPSPPASVPAVDVHPEVLSLQESFAQVAAQVKPSVVNVSAVHVERYEAAPFEFYFGDPFEDFFGDFFGQPPSPRRSRPRPRTYQRRFEGMGSGVIIDPEGYVLTNEHVVRNADEIKVMLMGEENQSYTGRVIGKDAKTDLAVIKITAARKLPAAPLGNSSKVRVGDWVLAIGSPFGLSQTVTAGIISAERQSLIIEGREYRDLLQTDAAINRGNSGGPLVNVRGEVIGINSAIYAPTGVFAGIGFAIPVNRAKEILGDLIHKGRVVRGWLGVELSKAITPAVVKQFGLPDERGVLVNDVPKGSPADRAGIRRGDVIRTFDGVPVKDVDHLQSLVAKTPPKRTVRVQLIRDRKPLEVTLVIGERPSSVDETGRLQKEERPPSREETVASWWGMKVHAMNEQLAEMYGLPSGESGVVIVELEPGSQAESSGLTVGDLIRAVNQRPTTDLEAFRSVTKQVKPAEGIVFDLNRRGRPLYLSFMAR